MRPVTAQISARLGTRSGKTAAIASASLALLLSSCGPQTPEDVRSAAIAKCERQFGRMAPDPSKGNALCTCMTDRLAEKGLEVMDMLGGDRAEVEEVTRSCAAQAGISLPAG